MVTTLFKYIFRKCEKVMRFGCHVSIRNGYLGAAKQVHAWNGVAYQYFPKNPRSLSVKDFDLENAALCKKFCLENEIVSIAHTPYPTSITPASDKRELTVKSLINDLEIAGACGSIGVVVHFGSQINPNEPLASYHLMIEILNEVLGQWDGECLILLENTAGIPGSIGTTLEEMVQVRNLVDEPHKIGFCLDTCHAFSSGIWNERNLGEFLMKGEELGYFEHLKAVHLNNSKYPTESGKDRHANIFNTGHIQEKEFEDLLFSEPLRGLPFILETPSDEGVTHKEEIELLYQKWGQTPHK